MSIRSKAWTVGAAVAAVEALKDQLGLCRWNYAMTSLHHHAKTRVSSLAQDARKMSTARSTAVAAGRGVKEAAEKPKKSEESMRAVMQLSCWLPS